MSIAVVLMLVLCVVGAYVRGVYVGFYGCQRMYEEAIAKMMIKNSRTRVSELYPDRDNE